MIKQTLHNIVDFKIGEIKSYPKGLHNEVFYTRDLLVTDKEGHRIELTLFTNDNKETLLPKRMED